MNALITGASKGIGKAIARQLASQDYNLFLCARDLFTLESLRAELRKLYPHLQIHVLSVDCEKPAEVEKLADSVAECFSVLDVLINNVGLYIPANILDEEADTLGRQMQVNLYTAYYLSKFFGKEMRSRKSGHIFNICSVASIRPFVNAGSYCVTKFALLGLTKVLREELSEYRVKVTAILPGATFTDSWSDVTWHPDKFVAPEDVASVIVNCLKMTQGATVEEILIKPQLGNL